MVFDRLQHKQASFFVLETPSINPLNLLSKQACRAHGALAAYGVFLWENFLAFYYVFTP